MATGKLIVITAPSGAGKTSITHYLLQHIAQLSFSISAATRQPRHNELNGKDYYFMSEKEFKQKIAANEFLEWEMVYEGKYYGTLKLELDRLWAVGKIPVLDIDVKGAIHVEKQLEEDCFSMFIEPPNVDELRKRLESRGTETPETLATRLNKASYEMSFKDSFDAIVVNDHLPTAQKKALELISQFIANPTP